MKVELLSIWFTLLVLSVKECSVTALSVIVPHPFIRIQLGDTAIIGCVFNKRKWTDSDQLRIVWYFYQGDVKKLVHRYTFGEDRVEAQHPSFQGRAHLFKKDIENGNASLHLSSVKLSDAGRYQCLVAYNGSVSHDDCNIDIYAPYKNGRLFLTRKGDIFSALCKFSDGYPGTIIMWHYSDGETTDQQGKTQLSNTVRGTYDLWSTMLSPVAVNGVLCCSLKDTQNSNNTICKNIAETLKLNNVWLGTVTVCVFIIIVAAVVSCHGNCSCNCLQGEVKKKARLRTQKQAYKVNKLPDADRYPNGVRPKFTFCPPRILHFSKHADHLRGAQGTEIQPLQPQVKGNGASISTRIVLMGLSGHRKEFLLMFCHYRHGQQCVVCSTAATNDKSNGTLPLGEGLCISHEKDFEYSQMYHHKLWKKYLKDLKATDNGQKQKERIIFVFIYRCTEALNTKRKQEIKDLYNFLKTHTGSFPITVLTNSSALKTPDVIGFFRCLGCREVLTFRTLKPENMQDSKERDDKINIFIHTCLCRSNTTMKKKQSHSIQVALESTL
ncbi:uncharacterized protein LOC122815438 isoform X2 [Protopterus annectens]|uniref:uncharacterized protein LOC122815438 isoform X2 n=1 Tax=Protopterus annectens TaxID=7888 RepID=UPI001CFBE59D|nr:uncharacterized protein LOC122815438 isoform X2 [Protopterus annectens]